MKLSNLHKIIELNSQYEALNGIWTAVQKPESRVVIAATDTETGQTHDMQLSRNEAIEVIQRPMQRVVDELKNLGVDV